MRRAVEPASVRRKRPILRLEWKRESAWRDLALRSISVTNVAARADSTMVKRKHSPTHSAPRLYGGWLLGWTWPVADLVARLRAGWYVWLALVGGVLVVAAQVVVQVFMPSLVQTNAVEIAWGIGFGLPFAHLFVVFLTAPLAARWRWAEQQLVINWAMLHEGEVRKRTEYWDFASSEWEQSGRVASDAPVLAHGDAIGFPTVATAEGATVGRAVLAFRSALARTGRSRGSRDVIVFAFMPVSLPDDFAVSKLCCWRRALTTKAQARFLEHLDAQSFESIQFDDRVNIGIAKQDDPLLVRKIIDPVTVDRFAASDTVWEVTRRGVTAYRRRRITRVAQIDELVADAAFLVARLESVSRTGSRAA